MNLMKNIVFILYVINNWILMLCFNFSSCSGKQLRNLKLYPFNVRRESASKDTHSKKKNVNRVLGSCFEHRIVLIFMKIRIVGVLTFANMKE